MTPGGIIDNVGYMVGDHEAAEADLIERFHQVEHIAVTLVDGRIYDLGEGVKSVNG